MGGTGAVILDHEMETVCQGWQKKIEGKRPSTLKPPEEPRTVYTLAALEEKEKVLLTSSH